MNSVISNLDVIKNKLEDLLKRYHAIQNERDESILKNKILEEELKNIKHQLEQKQNENLPISQVVPNPIKDNDNEYSKEVLKSKLDGYIAEIDQCIALIQKK